MKKKKLSIGLVSGFIGALALSACSSVTTNDKAIVSFKGYDGEQVTVLTNTVYNKYRESSDGISKYYSAILEAIIRYQFDSIGESGTVYKKSNAQIKTEAENNVTGAKQKAEENAKTNNTSYSEEWDAILTSYGVKDEDELLEHFIYDIEKDEIQDKFFVDNKEALTREYLGVSDAGEAVASKVKSSFPYHIRHVLVSIAEGDTDYYHATISQDQAKKLGTVIDYLTDSSYTFAQVAEKLSGDTGSAAKGGDVGIMTLSTSFVNEFKLGLYAYDAVYSGRAENAAIKEGLGLNETIKLGSTETTIYDAVEDIELQKVPYDAFVRIGNKAETETDIYGKKVNDGNANFFPRNVYWNNYLNIHNPFVVTNKKINADGSESVDPSITDFARWSEPVDGDGTRYLTDENGRVVVGVRSSHGIHLMIMQQSIYDFREGGIEDPLPSLEEYYTTYVPSDESFPYYTLGSEKVQKSTYVNYIKTSDASQYNTRATEIKDAIKSFDSTYDYRLYEYYVANGQIKFNDTDGLNLGEAIQKYIDASRTSSVFKAEDDLTAAWKNYLELISVQNQERNYVTGETEAHEDIKRVVNVRCAIGYDLHTGTDWNHGGMCHYDE